MPHVYVIDQRLQRWAADLTTGSVRDGQPAHWPSLPAGLRPAREPNATISSWPMAEQGTCSRSLRMAFDPAGGLDSTMNISPDGTARFSTSMPPKRSVRSEEDDHTLILLCDARGALTSPRTWRDQMAPVSAGPSLIVEAAFDPPRISVRRVRSRPEVDPQGVERGGRGQVEVVRLRTTEAEVGGVLGHQQLAAQRAVRLVAVQPVVGGPPEPALGVEADPVVAGASAANSFPAAERRRSSTSNTQMWCSWLSTTKSRV